MSGNFARVLHLKRFRVFEFVRLVKHCVVPFVFSQLRQTNVKRVVSSNTDVKFSSLHLVLDYVVAELHFRIEIYSSEVRSPPRKLQHPVRDRAFRSNYKVGITALVLALPQVAKERDRLHSLAKAHVVSKNSVHLVFVQRSHPLQTIELVGLERAILKNFRLSDVA